MNKQSSILNQFKLKNVHGYKDFLINFHEDVTVILAENGFGKTTILMSLYYFISGQFSKLLPLPFTELELQFKDGEIINFNKQQALTIDPKSKDRLIRMTLRLPPTQSLEDIDISKNIDKLAVLYFSKQSQLIKEDDFFKFLYVNTPWDDDELYERLAKIFDKMIQNEYISDIRKKISERFTNIDILLLTTYRRIEATEEDLQFNNALDGFNSINYFNNIRKRRFIEDNDQLINFGLSDVEKQLNILTNSIKKDLLQSYQSLSNNIIDTLLDDRPEIVEITDEDKKTIKVMLERLGNYTDDKIKQILDAIDNNKHNNPLIYLFIKLIDSYKKSKDQENAIENFVNLINDYFRMSDFNDKLIRFDKTKLTVDVFNTHLEEPIQLGSLSSGEKQIISIFSKLILNLDKKFLILIDEPELSLSLEWQQRLLPDMLKQNSFNQIIAITHSPFIFDNEFDANATTIEIKINGK